MSISLENGTLSKQPLKTAYTLPPQVMHDESRLRSKCEQIGTIAPAKKMFVN